jgi:hypothetical protein
MQKLFKLDVTGGLKIMDVFFGHSGADQGVKVSSP